MITASCFLELAGHVLVLPRVGAIKCTTHGVQVVFTMLYQAGISRVSPAAPAGCDPAIIPEANTGTLLQPELSPSHPHSPSYLVQQVCYHLMAVTLPQLFINTLPRTCHTHFFVSCIHDFPSCLAVPSCLAPLPSKETGSR